MSLGVDQFTAELKIMINRIADNFDISYAEMVGVLYMEAMILTNRAIKQKEEDEK